MLNIENPPGAAWWGEGDEKIYVDGESFPSLFGTGTEDYFGYAWSTPERFEHAYHAQTRGGRQRLRRPVVDEPISHPRPDPVHARAAFRSGDLALDETTVAVDATVYWYARPGGRDDLHSSTGSASRPDAR